MTGLPEIARYKNRIAELKAQKKLLLADFTNHRQTAIKELAKKNDRITELEAENERLKWMLEHICKRASAGTWYARMPWVSKEEMLADLDRRWADEGAP